MTNPPDVRPTPEPAAGAAPPVPAEDPVDILLVDDQASNLEALEAVLGDLRQNLYRATSGEEALRMMFHRDFAVVLLDVRMPGMDGFETAGFIRRRPRSSHTPIIFVTGVDDSMSQISRGYSLGAVDYILKPIHADILRSKVRVFVELAHKTRSLEREVAERRRVEERLREANRELEAFSYTVSHDLRAPLRAMSGFSDLLLEDFGPALGETGADYARRIAASARHMDALIQDLLTFSRITSEKVDILDVDPEPLLGEALSRLALDHELIRRDGR
ncbi:MAG TPA: response regulator, partial [Planctomycetota bacterium]|nr:response regulator [Planctomycetota bacterium]